jgi:uncharacterized tellurite resistance protein B-like protein
MNFTDFIKNNGRRVNREHFIHLIQISKADGTISNDEYEVLHKEGKLFGLTDPEIDELIKSEKDNNYNPPYSLNEKFDHLFSIVEMVLVDEEVTEREMKMLRRFSHEAGFDDNIIEDLLKLMLEGVAKGTDEEILLKEFRKKFL